MNATALKSVKALNPKTADTKYTGHEPEWDDIKVLDSSERNIQLIKAFTWYNYHYGKSQAKQCVLDWLARHDQLSNLAKPWARVAESRVPNVLGWLCRINLRGLTFNDRERQYVGTTIAELVQGAVPEARPETAEESESGGSRVTIQDRLREKVVECAGEMEGMYDELIRNGAKMTADFKPIALIRGMNIAPQMVSEIADYWRQKQTELEAVHAGRDGQISEGYSNFTKLQIKNLIRFCEAVVNDCGAYVQIKKVERRPRKVKPVSAEKRAAKFKCITEFEEFKIKGLPAASLVDKSEAWLYDTKKRKLIHVVADTHVGVFTIKNNAIIGFGTAETLQKTVRKPAETLKALAAAGKPAARKIFKDLTTTETQFNGRGTENIMILKTW
jgi:hypothetical protein